MTSNLKIWHALEKTNPTHTTPFKRSGGFAGTAIKPIYSIMRLTEQFGPCGEGWGMTKPEFQVVNTENEILVYCTVALWHGKPENLVYGVGGDKVRAIQKSGPFNSDEAFKASYTDALSNAMKMIGVSADVHMGLFEDHKYVRDLEREFGEAESGRPSPEDYVAEASVWMREQSDAATINQAWSKELDNLLKLPLPLQTKLTVVRDEVLAKLSPKKPEAAPVDEWKLAGDDIKREIDGAIDTVSIREILESKKFLDFSAHSKSAGTFLRDRAEKRIGVIMQGGRAA